MKEPGLCIVIKGPSLVEAAHQIEEAVKVVDIVEWRLDLFATLDLSSLKKLRKKFDCQVIFTLRSISQGGSCNRTQEERLLFLEKLAQLCPTYLDVEYSASQAFIDSIKKQYPSIKIICSYHDFAKTPADFSVILDSMPAADFYKISCMARSSQDALSLLTFAKQAPGNCLLMSMGEFGSCSRILSPVVGRPFAYASLNDAQTAVPGQLSANDLIHTFSCKELSSSSAIYGLIGDPVSKSVSHISHNEVMRSLQLSSVYVKMGVAVDELEGFLYQAQQLGVRGLSVTMPLKEKVIEYCSEITPDAQAIGAVNTLAFQDGKIIGHNTDAPGILAALQSHIAVRGEKVVVLGAGGVAKAISWQLVQAGADAVICARDIKKAQATAFTVGCSAQELDAIANYSIIINATSVPLPIDPQYIIPGAVVMDVATVPKQTLFLQHALDRGCQVVYGYELFIKQAVLQFGIWFPGSDLKKVEQILAKSVLQEIDKFSKFA